jgi:transcriptional regulator with XRE-family HTH domain
MTKRKRTDSPFSKILSKLMDEKGIGVREAARIAEVGPSTVMSWRAGSLPENYVAVKKLAKALGTTLSYLLTGEDDSRPQGSIPSVAEVFDEAGRLFDGYAKITIQKLVPKTTNKKN